MPRLLVLLGLVVACSGDKDTDTDAPPADADADTDADADSDTDSDTDADTGDTGCPAPTPWYADSDGDSYGDPGTEVLACTAPTDHVADGSDCDDGDAAVHPGATEVCNAVDDDCDPATSEAGTIVSGGTAYATVQEALDAVAVGATIELCEGTYAEALVLRQDVTLVGVLGSAVTTVDAGGAPQTSTVFVRGGAATLQGLTLTGGTGTFNDGTTWGGGLYTGSSSGVTVQDCVIEGNTAGFGGGLVGSSLFPASDTLIDTVIRDNTATFGGGGFVLFNGSLTGVEVSGNEAPIGGGGSAWYWTVDADPTTLITNNTADHGGGLYPWDDGVWTGGVVQGNTANRSGGGVYVDDATGVHDVAIDGNSAPCGGGLAVYAGATLDASDLVLTANTATACDGGALEVIEGSLTCTTCDLGSGATDNAPGDVLVTYGLMQWTFSGEAGETFSCAPGPSGCVGL